MSKNSDLQGGVKSTRVTDKGLEIVVRFRNDSDRAIHYIASPRSYNYDPATSRLVVHLTDEHRPVLLQMATVRPVFRYVDPGADAELTLELPESLLVLAPPSDPSEKIGLRRLPIADATDIEVQVAWADTAYYEDSRNQDDPRAPTVRWQQHALQIRHSTT